MNTKKIILPQEQKQICIDALNAYKYSLEAQLTQGTEEDEDIKRTVFDIYGLIGILDTKYNLILEINKDDMDTFVSRHDVDFPNYVPLVEYKEAIPSFIENMDWELLRLQKDAILNSDLVSTEIDGLVHLIDAIQDLSVDTYGIDGKLVFPTISENEFDQFQLSKENTSKAKLADAITVIEAHGYSVEREYADVYIITMDGNQCSEGTLDKNEVIEVAETMQQHSQATKLGTDVVAGLMTALFLGRRIGASQPHLHNIPMVATLYTAIPPTLTRKHVFDNQQDSRRLQNVDKTLKPLLLCWRELSCFL